MNVPLFMKPSSSTNINTRLLTSQNLGGAMVVESGAILSITVCHFSNNVAYDTNGGVSAFGVRCSLALSISHPNISPQTQRISQGGAIFAQYQGTTIDLFGCIFENNHAASGKGDDIANWDGVAQITIHSSCPDIYAATALQLNALDTYNPINGPLFSQRCFQCPVGSIYSGSTNPSRLCTSCPANQTSSPDFMM